MKGMDTPSSILPLLAGIMVASNLFLIAVLAVTGRQNRKLRRANLELAAKLFEVLTNKV